MEKSCADVCAWLMGLGGMLPECVQRDLIRYVEKQRYDGAQFSAALAEKRFVLSGDIPGYQTIHDVRVRKVWESDFPGSLQNAAEAVGPGSPRPKSRSPSPGKPAIEPIINDPSQQIMTTSLSVPGQQMPAMMPMLSGGMQPGIGMTGFTGQAPAYPGYWPPPMQPSQPIIINAPAAPPQQFWPQMVPAGYPSQPAPSPLPVAAPDAGAGPSAPSDNRRRRSRDDRSLSPRHDDRHEQRSQRDERWGSPGLRRDGDRMDLRGSGASGGHGAQAPATERLSIAPGLLVKCIDRIVQRGGLDRRTAYQWLEDILPSELWAELYLYVVSEQSGPCEFTDPTRSLSLAAKLLQRGQDSGAMDLPSSRSGAMDLPSSRYHEGHAPGSWRGPSPGHSSGWGGGHVQQSWGVQQQQAQLRQSYDMLHSPRQQQQPPQFRHSWDTQHSMQQPHGLSMAQYSQVSPQHPSAFPHSNFREDMIHNLNNAPQPGRHMSEATLRSSPSREYISSQLPAGANSTLPALKTSVVEEAPPSPPLPAQRHMDQTGTSDDSFSWPRASDHRPRVDDQVPQSSPLPSQRQMDRASPSPSSNIDPVESESPPLPAQKRMNLVPPSPGLPAYREPLVSNADDIVAASKVTSSSLQDSDTENAPSTDSWSKPIKKEPWEMIPKEELARKGPAEIANWVRELHNIPEAVKEVMAEKILALSVDGRDFTDLLAGGSLADLGCPSPVHRVKISKFWHNLLQESIMSQAARDNALNASADRPVRLQV